MVSSSELLEKVCDSFSDLELLQLAEGTLKDLFVFTLMIDPCARVCSISFSFQEFLKNSFVDPTLPHGAEATSCPYLFCISVAFLFCCYLFFKNEQTGSQISGTSVLNKTIFPKQHIDVHPQIWRESNHRGVNIKKLNGIPRLRSANILLHNNTKGHFLCVGH